MSLTMGRSADPDAFRMGPEKARRLICVLHGVGDTAEGLAPVGDYLARSLPDTAAVALNAPDPFDGGFGGRQWFSLQGVTPENRIERVAAALPPLWARLDRLVEAEGLTPAELVLFGFSQGAMMTLSSAATGRAFAAGLAFSGRNCAEIGPPHAGSPKLFITHGLDDSVVPAVDSDTAARDFTRAGYKVTYGTVAGVDHTIVLPQLEAAVRFLQSA